MRGRSILGGVMAVVLAASGGCAPATTTIPMALTGGASGASSPSDGCRDVDECRGLGGGMGDVGVAIVGAAAFGLLTALIGHDVRSRRNGRSR
jgi:hypothetical protein